MPDLLPGGNLMALPEAREACLAELAALEDGWLDGDSLTLPPEVIDRAREFMVAGEHLGTDRYAIFPTEDGGVLMKSFDADALSVSVEITRLGAIDVWAADSKAFLVTKEALLDRNVGTVAEAVEALAAVIKNAQ